ncbi:phosphoglycerate mutase-like protein [Guyanagaster necrorhizus]|uniref:Phosphoglycerate mutase-like protein n=1 Tax=Guyanagaster necrorhizus TaxID=856835 RepID=A0A9P7VVV3_9AGAR|nr:phosphoglycerate mutase-like protein [Guyanagaster necrorhizus MCA 3950]KAG7447894.1 phosphoglycerate mutase-like protein [Guyanagaster necrorhizus MCA 3950]
MVDSTIIGVVLLARHGDRQGFYQDPSSYTASSTTITPLGNQQEYQLGQLLRSLYLNSSSESYIPGINSTIVDLDQVKVRADGGDEGGVIFNSATSLLQGLFPANSSYTVTLANGTTVEGPLGGYQYIPIESVDPDNDVSLEGWASCGAFETSNSAFYNSTAFQAKANESASFLSLLSPYLDGRPVTLENMWNIYDYMNVENIHDASFAASIPDTFMEQARDLANWHEYGVFSSPELAGIGNIAARTMLPSIFESFTSITDSDDPLKFSYLALAYKPFLSLFNMTGVAQMNPQLQGIVNYAAALAFEIRNSSSSDEPVLRFNFKNGTDDNGFTMYNILNSTGDVPLSTFVNYLSPAAINATADWCTACGNTEDRGCGALALAASEASAAAQVHQRIGPVGAGFLGAGLTLAVCLAMLGVLVFLGFLTVGKGRSRKKINKSTEKA